MTVKYIVKGFKGHYGGSPHIVKILEEHNSRIEDQALMVGIRHMWTCEDVKEVRICKPK